MPSFFFYAHGAPRHLPSSPTRRSSDLIHPQHFALLAAVLPRQHDDGVVLLHMRLEVGLFLFCVCSSVHQMTSGANEMIFMNLRSRSSRATGPKTRVPTGSRASLMRTAALSSNLM